MCHKPSEEDRSKFDIDLSKGEYGESLLMDILKSSKIEVKSEQGRWKNTGNICIEYESYGRDSGIEVTECDYWVQNLMVNNELFASVIIPIEVLKKVVATGAFRTVSGGDHYASKMYLVCIEKLFSREIVEAVMSIKDE